MKKDFENFYNECLQDDDLFTEWEEERDKKRRKTKVATTFVIIFNVIILFLIICFYRKFGLLYILFPTVIICFIVDIIIYGIASLGINDKYNNLYKEKIIDNLLKNFVNDVDYIPKKQMPQDIYREPKYEGYYNRYYSDDYMEGLINEKYSIKMAEVTTQEVETKTDSDGHTHTETTTIFSGLFAIVNIKKSINNEFRIKQNGTIYKNNKLEMDSDEFEKYFDVSSTNDIVGMQLLTHDIMDLLTDYRKKLKRPFDIIIKDDIMYIRLHIGTMFEGIFNKKFFIDKNSLEKYFNMVNFIYELSIQMIKVVEETQI